MPSSSKVGTSGKSGFRTVPVTASARSLPDFTCGPALAIVVIITFTCPLIKSIIAGDEPRYGTLVNFRPLRARNRSTTTLPVPAIAMLSLGSLR
jgi:hypothetical protein